MIIYLDCSNGIAGDMLAAALLAAVRNRQGDSVALEERLLAAFAALGLEAGVARLEDVRRGGLAALQFTVADAPGFATFSEIETAVRAAQAAGGLEDAVADDVCATAACMAQAERAAHGGEGEPHLHELAGVDTIVDLVAAAVLMQALAPEAVVASPPALGGGTIDGSHGRVPVPGPAVLALLKGLPTSGGSGEGYAGGGGSGYGAVDPAARSAATEGQAVTIPPVELTTPTGAALLAHYATGFGPLPAGRLLASGCGAGSRELPGRPNVLRAVFVEPAAVDAAGATAGASSGTPLVLLESNIDDATGELLAHAAEALRAAGARDVWLTPAIMKKGRPGTVLHVLVDAGDEQRFADLVFTETTTFGVRVSPIDRVEVEQRRETVEVDGFAVGVRLALVGGRVVTVSPEYEDCRAAAAASGRPLKNIFAEADAAARGLTEFSRNM